MKILVMKYQTAKVFSVECESTDTIAHLKVKLKKIANTWAINHIFDGKQLGDYCAHSENMTLADVGIQDGSLIIESYHDEYRSCQKPRRPENDYLYYADAFKSGWIEEHAKALLHLLLELCQDGTISEGNVTDEAWLRIQNSLNNSMKCSFQIDFLKERLHDYKQLYSVLAETTSSSIFEWDRERKIITTYSYNWREEYPELLLLCGPHIPYFDTLEEVSLLVNTTRSSEQRVSEISTNINNAREASSSMGEICIQRPSDTNLSPIDSSTSIGKENGYLSSTMKILVVDGTAKVVSLECESTDTIAHLKEKLEEIKGISSFDLHLMFDGKLLGDEFSENMMLADVGVQDGSFILGKGRHRISHRISIGRSCRLLEMPRSPRRIPEKDYLYYADAFKSGWREEHAKALLHLLLELCQDGTISEGNVTDEAWLRIQNSLKNSMNCGFQIDFLKQRLCDYKQLYSVLTETSSPIFKWGRERKIITIDFFYNWREEYPELQLLCGEHIPYFDTLEEVCLLVNTTRSSEQRVSEISTNINNAREASSSMGEICIRRLSDSNLSPMGSSTLIRKENGYLSSTMKILVVDQYAKVFSLECESTDTIAHLKAKLDKITLISLCKQRLMFDGKLLGDEFSENMTLADVGVQDGSLILESYTLSIQQTGIIERPQQRPKNDYLYYADAFKSGWREEHAKALLELCKDGTISEGNVTDEAWLGIQNNLNNSMKCSFQIDFLKERLCDYKQLYSVLAETTSSSIFNWDRERKIITIRPNRRLSDDDDWREEFPELLLLCGPYIPYFDTLEKVCLLLNTGQSSEQRVSESSTNISTMHGKRVRQDIPRHSKIRSLFCKSQRS